MGLQYGENCMILTATVFDWSTRVTDRLTDGQTVYAMLSRAKKLSSNQAPGWASRVGTSIALS